MRSFCHSFITWAKHQQKCQLFPKAHRNLDDTGVLIRAKSIITAYIRSSGKARARLIKRSGRMRIVEMRAAVDADVRVSTEVCFASLKERFNQNHVSV